jgi:hypothetical protein
LGKWLLESKDHGGNQHHEGRDPNKFQTILRSLYWFFSNWLSGFGLLGVVITVLHITSPLAVKERYFLPYAVV